MPSAVSPWRRWKRLTARLVPLPKIPSARTPSQRWALRHARALGALLERLRRGMRRGRREHARTSASAPAVASARQRERPSAASSSIAKSVRSLVMASVMRLRGELTGSRCLRYATEDGGDSPLRPQRTAPVPPFATARGGGDSAAVVLPPECPAPAGFLARARIETRGCSAEVEPPELGAPRAATLDACAAVAELVDAQASGACELYARGGSSPLSRIRSLPCDAVPAAIV